MIKLLNNVWIKFLSTKFLLILICLLYLFTRLYKISEIPPSVYWDEASIGYNAYSILKTGKDEWGDFLPLHFRAFGEFKLPVYIYATIASVKMFGLNEFSVRGPSVLFSFGVVILTFILGKKLSGSSYIGLWSSFLITISPWFFIFSRTGYEATAGLAFFLLALYLIIRKPLDNLSLIGTTFSFILSVYSYNSFRVIVPLIILPILFFGIFKKLLSFKKLVLGWLICIILISLSFIPIFRLYRQDVGAVRLRAVGVSNIWQLPQNYLSHFSSDFLIFHGDKNLRSQQRSFGQLYLIDLPLFMLGLLFILKQRNTNYLLPVLIILIAPIPAALTKESPHALRSMAIIPFIAIISAAGVYSIYQKYKFKLITPLLLVIYIIFLTNYFYNFVTHYPVDSSKDFQYGYKKLFLDYKDQFNKYDKVIISDQYAQPYIFALFYLKYDPQKFQDLVIRNDVDQWGFSTVAKFDKFAFGRVSNFEGDTTQTLIFTDEKILNKNRTNSVKFLDGRNAFWVYQF